MSSLTKQIVTHSSHCKNSHFKKCGLAVVFCLLLAAGQLHAADTEEMCGDSGVWLQILGAGGPEIDDGQGGPSYLLWLDGKARVLIDTGPGASVAFDRAKARFEDIEVIAFTHLHVDHAGDFPAFIKGSYFLERTEPLYVLGPDSNHAQFPDTETFVQRLIGPDGAFAYLQDFLTHKSSGGYRIRARNVPATGKRPWSQFASANTKLLAVPVNHSIVPALAWRVEIGGLAVVFTGDFNNQKNVLPAFAKGATALVANHAIAEVARGSQRELHALPSQLGRIAKQADVSTLVLGHRMNRTRGRESQTRGHIEEEFDGYLLFANDMECWGL